MGKTGEKENETVLHMIVEQTYKYPMRIRYIPETNSFEETDKSSLGYSRNFTKPYGWIKESGTPPKPHHDCLLMTDKEYDLGDELEIKVIGVFMRGDLDHKYVVVEAVRDITDISELPEAEMDELRRLYPRLREGEGWFGRAQALYCMEHHEKAL